MKKNSVLVLAPKSAYPYLDNYVFKDINTDKFELLFDPVVSMKNHNQTESFYNKSSDYVQYYVENVLTESQREGLSADDIHFMILFCNDIYETINQNNYICEQNQKRVDESDGCLYVTYNFPKPIKMTNPILKQFCDKLLRQVNKLEKKLLKDVFAYAKGKGKSTKVISLDERIASKLAPVNPIKHTIPTEKQLKKAS